MVSAMLQESFEGTTFPPTVATPGSPQQGSPPLVILQLLLDKAEPFMRPISAVTPLPSTSRRFLCHCRPRKPLPSELTPTPVRGILQVVVGSHSPTRSRLQLTASMRHPEGTGSIRRGEMVVARTALSVRPTAAYHPGAGRSQGASLLGIFLESLWGRTDLFTWYTSAAAISC